MVGTGLSRLRQRTILVYLTLQDSHDKVIEFTVLLKKCLALIAIL
jgi:hypothetical protein